MKTNKKIKIRYLRSLNISKWLNHYKNAEKGTLHLKDNKLELRGPLLNEEIVKLIDASYHSIGGIHTER